MLSLTIYLVYSAANPWGGGRGGLMRDAIPSNPFERKLNCRDLCSFFSGHWNSANIASYRFRVMVTNLPHFERNKSDHAASIYLVTPYGRSNDGNFTCFWFYICRTQSADSVLWLCFLIISFTFNIWLKPHWINKLVFISILITCFIN